MGNPINGYKFRYNFYLRENSKHISTLGFFLNFPFHLRKLIYAIYAIYAEAVSGSVPNIF